MFSLEINHPYGWSCPVVTAHTDEPRRAIGIDDIEQIDHVGSHFLLKGNNVIGVAGHGDWYLLMLFVAANSPLVKYLRSIC